MKGAGDLLRNVQRVQEQLARAMAELAERRVEATAGGGVVRAVVSGRREVVELAISPEVVDPADVTMLQDLVMVAVNEALCKMEMTLADEVARVTGIRGAPPF